MKCGVGVKFRVRARLRLGLELGSQLGVSYCFCAAIWRNKEWLRV